MNIAFNIAHSVRKPTPEWAEKKYKSDLPLSDSDRCRSQLIIFCGEFLIGVNKSRECDSTWRPLRDRSAVARGYTVCGVGEGRPAPPCSPYVRAAVEDVARNPKDSLSLGSRAPRAGRSFALDAK